MKRILTLILLIACITDVAFAGVADNEVRRRATIKGRVEDMVTKKPVPFAGVVIKGTMIGTTTNESGYYILRGVPVGRLTLEITSIGFATVRKVVEISENESFILDVLLEEEESELDEVVVSANRSETTRKLAPTLVNVVSLKTLEETNSACLSQGLNFQPGVRVETNCQNCGFRQVRINGLDGHYSQILIDSRPIFSALAGVYGLDQIPTNMIDRVEVIRGGGSALFGSSAIAGTVNVITKEPSRNSFAVAHNLSNIGLKNSFINNTTVNSSFVSQDNNFGISTYGQISDRDSYDSDRDGFTEMPELKNRMVGIRSFFKTGDYSKITAEYHYLHEHRRGGNNLSRPPHEADIAEALKHDVGSGNVKFDYFSPNQKHKLSVFGAAQQVHRDSYYGVKKDLNAYGETTDFTFVTGVQYNYKFDKCLFMPAELVGGAEYNQDDIKDNMWGYNRYVNQNVKIGSVFFQNEWKNDKLGILLGGRFDKHNHVKRPIFSPRVNFRYNPIQEVNLRLSYSFGFRAPQAFDEDLHIENVGGTVSMIRLAKDLKEERSRSLSLSADLYHNWNSWQANLLLEGFYTRLADAFALKDIGLENGIMIKERINESGANVYGGVVEGKLSYKKYMQLQAGLTLQRAEYFDARNWSEDEELPLEKRIFRTPDVYGYFTLSSNPIADWELTFSGNYTGSMLVEHHKGFIDKDRTEKTKGFMELNFKTGYDFRIYKNMILEINAGVQNIFNAYQNDFDKGIDRDANYIYGPGNPRILFAGIKISY